MKDPKDDDDDEPVYVDEESNEVISKEEYKALTQGTNSQKDDGAVAQGQPTTERTDETQPQTESIAKQSNLTEVGGQKKRKQANIVADEQNPETMEAPTKASVARKPKKAKKIKLSFDEEQ